MKATKRIIGRLIVGCVLACCLTLFAIQAFAIEGLQVSVQSSNAVVSWPSADSETYIVQYRSNLSASASWLTLTDFYAADSSSNVTYFLHCNSVTYPPVIPGSTNVGSIDPDPNNTNTASGGTNTFFSTTGFYRVVRDGAHIYGLTNNSTLSGEVQMPIEISVNSTDSIESVTFFNSADDSPVIGASAYVNDAGTWVFDWNTVMVENGSNNIYAEVDFTTDDPVSSANLPVSLTVNNTISFPNYFTSIFGSQMWIYAETIPDASFQIDIYDENTNYLGTFADFADDSGVISFLWDLTDGSGNTFDSTNFSGVFTVDTSSPNIRSNVRLKNNSISTNSPSFHKLVQKPLIKSNGIHANNTGSSSSATNHWALETAWSGLGGFVVAYAPLTDPGIDPNTSFKESLMMLGGSDGDDIGVIGSLDGNDFHGHLSPGNVPQTSAFEMGNLTNKTNLLGYLADFTYRNFYFFGHGNATVISAYNGSGVAISAKTIQDTLGNFLTTSKPRNFHPYRFVFIDGCENGKGKFCEAFGIPAQTVNIAFFAAAGVRSRAYLGFKNSISFDVAQWDWRSLMLGGFFLDWTSGTVTLQNCVNNAVSAIHSNGFQPMDSSWVIYGATDLKKNSP